MLCYANSTHIQTHTSLSSTYHWPRCSGSISLRWEESWRCWCQDSQLKLQTDCWPPLAVKTKRKVNVVNVPYTCVASQTTNNHLRVCVHMWVHLCGVCVWVYTCGCIYVGYVCECTHVGASMWGMCVCVHMWVHLCGVCVCVYTCGCIYVGYVCVYTCGCIYVGYVCECTHVGASMCECTHVGASMWGMCVCVHMWVHLCGVCGVYTYLWSMHVSVCVCACMCVCVVE